MAIDFSKEMGIAQEQTVQLHEELNNTRLGTRADCSCGKSERQHLLERLIALDVIWEVMNGNPDPLLHYMEASGPNYLVFAVAQIYQDKSDVSNLLERIGESLIPDSDTPGASPQNQYGLLH